MLTAALYAYLAGFYLFYFAALGVFLPYWGLYLRGLGFEPAQIGELTAIPQVTKVIAPTLWGWLADSSGLRIQTVRWACLATLLSFIGVYAAGNSYVALALTGLLYSFFWNAALPQFEAITLRHLGAYVHLYSRVRLWGSVGFVFAAVGVGYLVAHWGIGMVPALVLGCFGAMWLISLRVTDQFAVPVIQTSSTLLQVLRLPVVISFFIICFLNQLAHGPYYGFFSLYLEYRGYSPELIGLLWGLGVTVEVGMFLLMPPLLQRYGPRCLILWALVLATLRWLLIGHLSHWVAFLLFAQMLHAFSFGVFHAASMHLIYQFFPGSLQGRGQALYSSLSFGVGNSLGGLAAGYLWQGLGPTAMFDLAAFSGMLCWLVAWRGLRL